MSLNYLHSTMYLLKLFPRNILISCFVDLHSTMYLLKLIFFSHATNVTQLFTFHYVSIKTVTPAVKTAQFSKFTFHYVSIKTDRKRGACKLWLLFTFHYVSIKTLILIQIF